MIGSVIQVIYFSIFKYSKILPHHAVTSKGQPTIINRSHILQNSHAECWQTHFYFSWKEKKIFVLKYIVHDVQISKELEKCFIFYKNIYIYIMYIYMIHIFSILVDATILTCKPNRQISNVLQNFQKCKLYIKRGDTIVGWVALAEVRRPSAHSHYGVCMFYLYLPSFSSGALASSHSVKTCIQVKMKNCYNHPNPINQNNALTVVRGVWAAFPIWSHCWGDAVITAAKGGAAASHCIFHWERWRNLQRNTK